MHDRCVQTAVNARSSPPASRTTIAGSAPKGTRRPLLGRSDEALPALTVSEVSSGTSGGLRNRRTGYATDASTPAPQTPSSQPSRSRRLAVAGGSDDSERAGVSNRARLPPGTGPVCPIQDTSRRHFFSGIRVTLMGFAEL